MTGRAQVRAPGGWGCTRTPDGLPPSSRVKDAALGGSGSDGPGIRDVLPKLHMLPPVCQEICDLPTEVWHVELGQLVLEETWVDGVEKRAEVHEQDPDVGSEGVQLLQSEGEDHVDSIIYRPVGSVDEQQDIQEVVCEVLRCDKISRSNDFMTTEVSATGL